MGSAPHPPIAPIPPTPFPMPEEFGGPVRAESLTVGSMASSISLLAKPPMAECAVSPFRLDPRLESAIGELRTPPSPWPIVGEGTGKDETALPFP